MSSLRVVVKRFLLGVVFLTAIMIYMLALAAAGVYRWVTGHGDYLGRNGR